VLGPAAPKLTLARAEVFDWFDRVSIELTTKMLTALTLDQRVSVRRS
jgi:hypothetical protein